MTSEIIKQWERMNESEKPGKVYKKPEIPGKFRVGALNKEKEKAGEKPEWVDEERKERKGINLSRLSRRLSRPGKILKSSSRATIKMPESKYSSILKERNIYFK